jgi:hypothetical protein
MSVDATLTMHKGCTVVRHGRNIPLQYSTHNFLLPNVLKQLNNEQGNAFGIVSAQRMATIAIKILQ